MSSTNPPLTSTLSLHPEGSAVGFHQSPRRPLIGAVLQSTSEQVAVEDELDRVIHQLGRAAEKAMADQDPTGARLYADRMHAAIASRTPEHQARLHAEIDRRIDELTMGGAWTDEVLNRAATHFDVPPKAVRRRMGGRAG